MAQDKITSTHEELHAKLWKDWEYRLWWYILYIPEQFIPLTIVKIKRLWHKT